MVQCILQNKIVFLGLQGFNYTYVKIKNRGITILDLTREEAKAIIDDENLQLVSSEECENYKYGRIYTDNKFKEYVNSHPKVKRNLIKIINRLDENN